MSNQTNPNWKETKNGWEKNDNSHAQGAKIDWDRPKRISNWIDQIRRERQERNDKANRNGK